MFGMEIETRIPVTFKDGESIEEYPHIAVHNKNQYHIDVDRSNGTSILEFVMHAFDEHRTTEEQALKELDTRLESIERFITAANEAASGTLFREVCERFDVTVEPAYEEIVLNIVTIASSERLKGPVHFTVGFAPEVIPRLITEKLSQASFVNDDEKTIQRASEAANLPIDTLKPRIIRSATPPEVICQRKGYLALLYMQIAAAMDGVKDTDRRLVKNKTQALCRVPFSVIYGKLPATEQLWLSKNQDAILGCMRRQYSGQKQASDQKQASKIVETWGEHKKDTELIPRPAQPIVSAAFGIEHTTAFGVERADGNPQDVFGKMTIILNGEPVGPPEQKRFGYALELRKLKVTSGNPDSRKTVAHTLLAYSRSIHGTKG